MKRFVLSVAASLLCFAACSAPAPRQYSVKVVREYPHDDQAYTQGLFFEAGELYESTGQTGRSSFRIIQIHPELRGIHHRGQTDYHQSDKRQFLCVHPVFLLII